MTTKAEAEAEMEAKLDEVEAALDALDEEDGMESPPKCPWCGKSAIEATSTIRYKRGERELLVDVPVWRCPSSHPSLDERTWLFGTMKSWGRGDEIAAAAWLKHFGEPMPPGKAATKTGGNMKPEQIPMALLELPYFKTRAGLTDEEARVAFEALPPAEQDEVRAAVHSANLEAMIKRGTQLSLIRMLGSADTTPEQRKHIAQSGLVPGYHGQSNSESGPEPRSKPEPEPKPE